MVETTERCDSHSATTTGAIRVLLVEDNPVEARLIAEMFADTALGALAIGDLPGISMILIDGEVRIGRSRNTAPAARTAEVVGGGGSAAGGH